MSHRRHRRARPRRRVVPWVVALVVLGLVVPALGVVVLVTRPDRGHGAAPAVAPLRLALVGAFAAPGSPARSQPSAPPGPVPTSAPATLWPRSVLARWDELRGVAWAHDDVQALRRLYTERSEAGRRDVAMLARWRARGLRVVGLTEQLTTVEVLHRGPGRLTLRVTDRVVGAVAVGRGVDRPLPADRPTTRVLALRHVGGRWRMGAVRQLDRG